MTVTYLDRILDGHRADAREDIRSLEALVAKTTELAPARGFRSALQNAEPLGVIAEVKRRSPSKGDLNVDLDPRALSTAYRDGGAACCSVLTDKQWFGGSPMDLAAVHEAVDLPIIRKDFTVSANDVVDTRLMGADCVLLIVAALSDSELQEFYDLAREIGLDALVEVHDEDEAERALAVGADLIGVNQRDLVTFEVDTARAVRVASLLPANVVRVAESGIRGPSDIPALVGAGFDSVLVGESLVTHSGPAAGVSALIAAATERSAEPCS